MSFSRSTPSLLQGSELNKALRSVGMRIGAEKASARRADLEVTLASAAEASLPHDYRLLSVLVTWLELHHGRLNVPRLLRTVRTTSNRPLVLAFWASVGTWLGRTDPRFRSLSRLYQGPVLDLDDPEVTALQLQRAGEDPRFRGTRLRVHAKLLRTRPADVDDPVQLAVRHPLYLRRVELGANYRADVWAALDQEPEATPAQIARQVGCAYETARAVAEDWKIAHRAARSR